MTTHAKKFSVGSKVSAKFVTPTFRVEALPPEDEPPPPQPTRNVVAIPTAKPAVTSFLSLEFNTINTLLSVVDYERPHPRAILPFPYLQPI